MMFECYSCRKELKSRVCWNLIATSSYFDTEFWKRAIIRYFINLIICMLSCIIYFWIWRNSAPVNNRFAMFLTFLWLKHLLKLKTVSGYFWLWGGAEPGGYNRGTGSLKIIEFWPSSKNFVHLTSYWTFDNFLFLSVTFWVQASYWNKWKSSLFFICFATG